jgi:hypothetical protein
VLSSVAVARTDSVIAGATQPVDTAFALTEGFQAAFLIALAVAALGALLALALFGRTGEPEDAAIERAQRMPPCPPVHASGAPALAAEREI